MNIDTQLAALVASGDVEITGSNGDGETTYRLTEQGEKRALGLLHAQSWARDMMNRLSGGVGPTMCEPPPKPQ